MLAVRRTRHRNGRAELTAYREACAGGEWQLYVAGEFDDATTGSLADVLDDACRERARRIVIDCSAVTFADVAFLRALLTPHAHDVQVVLAAPSGALRRLLQATGTVSRFPVTNRAGSVPTG
ncbi:MULTISPECIES: STAS domain-containing protein [Streptomyces]|uniref:STAS domain-containing protein n=2 Tax=Streptomyces TaxID=1883 RepID=A0ABY9JLQ7_9ACTN|nr:MULTISPECIES: STAS domain-containing protein [unclassified Streptomyces]WSQ81915.1 STAS domain-containing protein [Streptomyces sp. NBC_01213]WLQ68558.1 STAS domain-containing protein [Streptomyces sp. Alt3]WSQ89244.1 STAS domain-containing protein [Streptomyces sp. NBC_01212]WSR04749.1 STAS domain-containing protein [Streptomyces sp. NBC_01208]WSR52636.1 STAS domain-containing protein [Streptomyces sp. NBC_01201]